MAQSNRQIEQMVNFIMQEAHEKANELRIKTEHDFNLEKQMLVHNARLRIQEEFTQKNKDFEIQQRVARSVAIGEARVQRMQHRDAMLQELRESTSHRLAAVSNTAQYTTLLKQLIVQGLLRVQEQTVSIRCRQTDLAKVKQVLPEAVAEYTKLQRDAGYNVNPNVTVDETGENFLNEKRCSGGVVITALAGKIICDNTLDARLEIAYMQQLPVIRQRLFPEVKPASA